MWFNGFITWLRVEVWPALKKIPWYAWMALMFLFAIVFWLIKARALDKAKKAVIEDIAGLNRRFEIESKEHVEKMGAENKEAYIEYTDELADLEEREKEINAAIEEGPAAITARWNEYFQSTRK